MTESRSPDDTYLELEVHTPGGKRRHVAHGPVVIGRHGSASQIVVAVPELSKAHLQVEPHGGGARIRDLGSKNGTTVNGEVLQGARAVSERDVIELGGVVRVTVRGGAGVPDDTLPRMLDDAMRLVSGADPALAAELRERLDHLELRRDSLAWTAARLPDLHRATTSSERLRVLVDEAVGLTKAVVWAVAWEGDLASGRVHYRHLVHKGDTTGLPEPGGIARTIIGQAVSGGLPVWTDNAHTDVRFSKAESVQMMRLRSVGCIPLGERAALYLSNQEVAGVFTPQMRARLTELCLAARSWIETPAAADDEAAPPAPTLPGLVGTSAAMRQVIEDVLTFARLPYTILILGPRGSGKSHLAKAIHELSGRGGQFVHASIVDQPTELVPDALFGHRAGAFTGARRPREGWAELSKDGTLLLDEIGDLAPSVQPSLLTMLQERTFQPVGDDKRYPFTGRVIAATNQPIDRPEDLETPFRRDLYDRLAEVVIRIPSLSERPSDIPSLAQHFFQQEQEKFREAGAHPPANIGQDTLMMLRNSTFDGNVRGLRAAVVRAMATAARERADVVRPNHMTRLASAPAVSSQSLDFESALDAYRRQLMLDAYAKADGKQIRAAELLGINNQKWHRLRSRLALSFAD